MTTRERGARYLILILFAALTGCSSIECHDSYWNKTLRDPLHWESGVWMVQSERGRIPDPDCGHEPYR
jgi:hypothetical protein